jgi:hypothetical protein
MCYVSARAEPTCALVSFPPLSLPPPKPQIHTGLLRRIILQALAPHRLTASVITPGVPLNLNLSPVAQQAALAAAAAAAVGGGAGSISGGMGSKTTSLVVGGGWWGGWGVMVWLGSVVGVDGGGGVEGWW